MAGFVRPRPSASAYGRRVFTHAGRPCPAAHFQDAGKLAAEMGHTSPAVVFQHYRELAEPEEAARYWNIRPAATPTNVVPMRAAGA